MWQDFRYGLRTLANNRGFTAVAVTALSLGIGANATVFALANAVLFKNLPFDHSERVLYISSGNTSRPGQTGGVSYPDFRDFQANVKSFDGLAAGYDCRSSVSDGTGARKRTGR